MILSFRFNPCTINFISYDKQMLICIGTTRFFEAKKSFYFRNFTMEKKSHLVQSIIKPGVNTIRIWPMLTSKHQNKNVIGLIGPKSLQIILFWVFSFLIWSYEDLGSFHVHSRGKDKYRTNSVFCLFQICKINHISPFPTCWSRLFRAEAH